MERVLTTTNDSKTTQYCDLLINVLEAHGGLENWRRATKLTVSLSFGGPFWAGRGWPDHLELTATLDTQREHITLAGPDRVSVFDVDPEHVTIRTLDGEIVESRTDPRSSFPQFDWETTRWDAIQIAYFLSASNWNYLTEPFGFTYTGVQAQEIEPWQEDGETWRRLAVTFPKSNANHNADQVFYYDADFMQHRMDYSPDVTATPGAQYTYDPATFHGFVFPTRRRVHLRNADGIADKSLAVITIDVAEVTVEHA
jgi:hypothetical protein